jgi:hypothetical protein
MAKKKNLLDNSFSVHPLQDSLRIVYEGRPARPLPNLILHHETNAEKYTRNFCIFQ